MTPQKKPLDRNFIPRLSLRTVLIVPFILQIFGTVGLIGYLSLRNGQKAVNDLATQLQHEVSDRVSLHLDNYLKTPLQLQQISLNAMEEGYLDLQNFPEAGKYFWQQLQVFDDISYMGYALTTGEFAGAGRFLKNQGFTIDELSANTGGNNHTYGIDSEGNRTETVKVYTPQDWNPLEDAWYTEALTRGKNGFNPVYMWVDDPDVISVSLSLPLYNNQQETIGVFNIDLFLSTISDFLRQLEVSPSSKVFIIERDGKLIANSTSHRPWIQENGKTQRLSVLDSPDSLIKQSASFLKQEFGDFQAIQAEQVLKFQVPGNSWWGMAQENNFIHVTPWQDKFGLDWLVIVVIPESDFMAQINANTRTTITLCIVALIIATTVGIVTARWVTKPILSLNDSAKDIARGKWNKTIDLKRSDEVGQLGESFHQMAQQLQLSFQKLEDYSQNLEKKVDERTKELSESQQLLNLVMNNIPQSIFWKNREGVFLGCNQSFAKTAGMTPQEIVGKTDYEMPWKKEEADFYRECDRQVMDANMPELGIVEPQLQADGKQSWLETSKVPLHDVNGDVMGIIAIFQDITPYKEAEQAAKQASQAKSEFLANMSHELRTPLNGILGYAQILGRSKNLPDKERKGVNIIHQCGSHLLTLINDILDLSKIEARKLELSPTPLHLPSLLQSVVEMCKIKGEQKGIDFLYYPSSRLPEGVEADEKRLRQVLINLLGNAIKFTDTGSVTLGVDVLEICDTQASMLFQIIDTGVGIAQENLTKLFEAFEQVGDRSKQSEGTGLGLAISQRIVQLMGGNVQVKSQLGEGSEFFFTVTLPLAEDWAQQQGTMANSDRIIGYKGNPLSILVVDDRWENRAVVYHLLEPLDFKVIEAENGQEGLEKLRNTQPDLVITDLAMPVMDGFEFIEKVRHCEELKDTKMLVSSASVSQMDQQMALDRGGDDFLAKPVDAGLLFKLLATHLDLEWIYEAKESDSQSSESQPRELILPSSSILEALLDFAGQANMKALRGKIEQLVEEDQAYIPFAETILQLAKQFQIEEIEELLQKYLTEEQINVG